MSAGHDDHQGRIKGQRWWDVLSETLPKKPSDGLRALAASQDAERLRLAVAGAGEAAFDWTMSDDRILWEGASEIFTGHIDPERLTRGAVFRGWMDPASQQKLATVIAHVAPNDCPFELEFEAGSAMGTAWFELRGVRVAGVDGKAERITGLLKCTTETRREVQRLTYLATRDELTGHLNRTSLRTELADAIDHARAEQRTCAYIVASIDRLAMINEAYGFGAADELIVSVGERLASTLRGSDVVGRIAGNKFGVILRHCSEREISIVSERLRAMVSGSVIATRRGSVSATISVGAVWLPSGASSSQEAMLRAEEALDRARASGRGGFSVYDNSPQREMARLRLMAIADDVVAALNDQRLLFAYQPIVDAVTKAPVHYECLLRMAKPDGSIVSAGHFIPAVEQLGLVRIVDRRTLEMAVAKLYTNPKVSLAVNVSGTTAGDPSWLESFVNYIRANQEVADRIVVELTETAALNDFEESARFVSKLREMGCRVAIDDFGAGYTSFRNLQMLHVDMVKIDGTFVKGISQSPDNQIFVRTLVDLAKNFKLKTVAEWVGSDEDAELLRSFGVDYFQGFHFGEPILDTEWVAA